VPASCARRDLPRRTPSPTAIPVHLLLASLVSSSGH
jgi:hypothetical protein